MLRCALAFLGLVLILMAASGCQNVDDVRRSAYQQDLNDGYGQGYAQGVEEGHRATLDAERVQARKEGAVYGVWLGAAAAALLVIAIALSQICLDVWRKERWLARSLHLYDEIKRPLVEQVFHEWKCLLGRRARGLSVVKRSEAQRQMKRELKEALSRVFLSLQREKRLPIFARRQMAREIEEAVYASIGL